MDSGFRRNDGFWTFDEFIKIHDFQKTMTDITLYKTGQEGADKILAGDRLLSQPAPLYIHGFSMSVK
jgi:hypothetical protein